MKFLFEVIRFLFSCFIIPLLCIACLIAYGLLTLVALLIIIEVITGKIGASFFQQFQFLIMWFLILYPLLGFGSMGIMNFLQDKLYS